MAQRTRPGTSQFESEGATPRAGLGGLEAAPDLSLLSDGEGCSCPREDPLVLLWNQPSGLWVQLRAVGAS